VGQAGVNEVIVRKPLDFPPAVAGAFIGCALEIREDGTP
jgi:hypothetical protein